MRLIFLRKYCQYCNVLMYSLNCSQHSPTPIPNGVFFIHLSFEWSITMNTVNIYTQMKMRNIAHPLFCIIIVINSLISFTHLIFLIFIIYCIFTNCHVVWSIPRTPSLLYCRSVIPKVLLQLTERCSRSLRKR